MNDNACGTGPSGSAAPARGISLASTLVRASSSTSQVVVAPARHAADELVGGGKARRAVREGVGNVEGVGGQDAQRPVPLEEDAGIVVAAVPGPGLVGDFRPKGRSEGSRVLSFCQERMSRPS
jgi:hypothetical protein